MLAGCTGLLNTMTPSGGHREATGVPYDTERDLRLDIYTPASARGVPVVVFFHGGRWSKGEPADYRFVGQALASRGFVAVVPEFRQYPQVRFPEFVNDAARAVRWTQQQIGRYGGDPSKLFVMGHSSGAHIAAMLALNPEYLQAAGTDRASLRGMIGLAGAYAFLPLTAPDLRDLFAPPERYELSQPIAFVDGEGPPLLLLHGENDDIIDVENTRRLSAAVVRAGGTVETVIYPKMSHSWIVSTLAAPLRGGSDVLEHVSEFVLRQSSAPPPRPGITGKALDDRR
jgi:acetyl esterase/lipase